MFFIFQDVPCMECQPTFTIKFKQVDEIPDDMLDVAIKLVASNTNADNAVKRVLADVMRFRWPGETTMLEGVKKTLCLPRHFRLPDELQADELPADKLPN